MELSGRLLQDAIFEAYQVQNSPRTIHFFDESGARNIFKHALNNRRRGAVQKNYVRSLVSKGLVLGVRGYLRGPRSQTCQNLVVVGWVSPMGTDREAFGCSQSLR